MDVLKLVVLLMLLITAPLGFADEKEVLFRATSDYTDVKIERVLKADLVVLDNGRKVRLIGLKTLEAPKRYDLPRDEYGFVIEDTANPETPMEDRVFDFANELMNHKKVRVELDTQAVDESGYVYGYVFLSDGKMANAEILRQGFSELQIRPPNLKYAEQLREAYREARREQRGIHANQ